MQDVLNQLITVPGVVGGMICDEEGQLLSTTFPPIFDDSLLASAARVLVDGAAGLETVTGKVGLLDMRFADARLVVRPMTGAHLVLLCAAQTNLQLLHMSASVAVPKLERLVASFSSPGEMPAVEAPEAEAVAAADVQEKDGDAEAAESATAPAKDPGFFHW